MASAVIDETIAAWTADPSAARGAPTVTAHLDAGQAAIQAGPFTMRADLPVGLGGTNQAPSPTALLLAALAGCAVVFIHDTLAPQLGIEVDELEATVSCTTDARGLLAMDGASPELQDISLVLRVGSPGGDDAVAELARVWQERCPVYLALGGANHVSATFEAT